MPSRACEGFDEADVLGASSRLGRGVEGCAADAEAMRFLTKRDSGMRPDLSRCDYRFVKRVFDVLVSGVALALLLVPGAFLCAVICAKSPGTGPLYSQWRVGRVRRDGSYRLFRMTGMTVYIVATGFGRRRYHVEIACEIAGRDNLMLDNLARGFWRHADGMSNEANFASGLTLAVA